MTSCQSAITFVSKLWKEYGDIATTLGCAATSDEDIMNCLEKTDNVEETAKKAMASFKRLAAKNNSSLTIGPRLLKPNTWEKGTIWGTTGRLFITAVPMDLDEVSLIIKELDGKGKVGIAICLVDQEGKDEKVIDYTLNENKSEKRNDSQEIRLTLRDVKGKFVICHIDGKSVANKFKYKIFLDS